MKDIGNQQAAMPWGQLREHYTVVRQIAGKLRSRYPWVSGDEISGYALLGFTMASSSFDSGRGVPFSSYAYHKGTYLAIDEMRRDRVVHRVRSGSPPKFYSISASLDGETRLVNQLPDERGNEDLQQVDHRDTLEFLLRRLNERDRKLLMMYYADELTFREIGEAFGVTESCVNLRHKGILTRLRRAALSLEDADA